MTRGVIYIISVECIDLGEENFRELDLHNRWGEYFDPGMGNKITCLLLNQSESRLHLILSQSESRLHMVSHYIAIRP